MNERIDNFFARNNLQPSQLVYLVHANKQTTLTFTDGRHASTSIALKELLSWLPQEQFWNIQKGIAVAARYVVSIDDDGIYTMMDGTRFTGRRRNPAEHKRRRSLLDHRSPFSLPMSLLEKCTLMDNAPIAFCIIELVFAPDGRGIDFIFRYCNKMMETVERKPISEMIDRSFYEVFENGDRKWIIPYADVALNGVTRELHDYSPEIGKDLIIQCFQPHPGFTACFLTLA